MALLRALSAALHALSTCPHCVAVDDAACHRHRGRLVLLLRRLRREVEAN